MKNNGLYLILLITVLLTGGIFFNSKNVSAVSCSSSGSGGINFVKFTDETLRVYARGVSADTAYVHFPDWSGNQDNIIWHLGINDGGGTWHHDIDLTRFPNITNDYMPIFFAAYMYNSAYTPAYNCGDTNHVINKLPDAPTTPTGLAVTAGACGTTTLNVSWNPATLAQEYTVLRVEGENSTRGVYQGTGTSFTDTGLTPGATYTYKVLSGNACNPVTLCGGYSSYSSTVSGTVASVCPGYIEGVPTVSLFVDPNAGVAPLAPKLTWSATNLPTSCEASGQWSGTKAGSGNNVVQPSLNTGGQYTYTLKCSNAVGTGSPKSVTVNVTPPPAPVHPDLTASVPSLGSAIIGVENTFSSTISNASGAESTEAAFSNVFQVAAGPGGAGEKNYITNPVNMGELKGGESAIATYKYIFTGEAGVRSVRFCADKNISMSGKIPESNEDNNCGATWKDVQVTSSPYVDLRAGAVSLDKAIIGVSQKYSSVISNDGNASTGISFPVLFQISTMPNGGGTVTPYKTPTNTPALGFGATAIASMDIKLETLGTVYVRACADKSSAADVAGDITEADPGSENNNCSPSWSPVVVSEEAMIGTLTPQATSCVIPLGGEDCTINFSWSTTNPERISAVTKNPSNTLVESGNSGNLKPFTIKYNSETFFLYNNAVLLAEKTVSSGCGSGARWDGIKCVKDDGDGGGPGGGGGGGNTCLYGAINFPTCSIDKDGVCVNGAVNPPVCSTGPGSLVNGRCSAYHFGCNSPFSSTDNATGISSWTWTCPGSGSGSTPASCAELKKKPTFIEN